MPKNSANKSKGISKTVADLLEPHEAPSYEGREGLIYRRVSSKRQETEGHGLEGQDTRCRNYLQTINVPATATFADSFTGGGDFMMRPAMRELLGYIDAHPHKKFVVVFDDLKRFARSVEFHIKLRAAFKARDVMLHCLNFSFEDSPTGNFAEIVMAAHGEMERLENRRQVIQKQMARLEKGYWPFTALRGYEMVKDPVHGKISKPNKGARILAEALEAFSTGNLLRPIDACQFLIDRGVWKRKSAARYVDDFKAMAQSCFYCGDIEYLPWGVSRRPGHHEGIISRETYELNRQRLDKPASEKQIRKDLNPDFPLRGLICCPACGGHVTSGKSKGRHGRYAYYKYACRNESCEYRGKSIGKDEVEKPFKQLLRRSRLKPETEKLISAVFDAVWKEEVSDVEKQQAAMNRKAKALGETLEELALAGAKAKSESARSAYEKQMEKTSAELEEIRSESIAGIDLSVPYRTALGKAVGLLKKPDIAWQKLDVAEQHRIFFFIFERKLAYSTENGYRTADIPTAAMLFEEFVDTNTPSVDPTGVEPASSNWQGRYPTVRRRAHFTRAPSTYQSYH